MVRSDWVKEMDWYCLQIKVKSDIFKNKTIINLVGHDFMQFDTIQWKYLNTIAFVKTWETFCESAYILWKLQWKQLLR